ncbi:hypothetical protein JCM19297_304 [Nonlabens ulvanivorans]|nr:hypothetical protein JCM19297_304 [Nonlabens ulvanivorans]
MRNILGINFKYYVGFVLMIGLVLVFIEPLSFILLEIGSKLNYDTTAFKSGYTIISFSIVVLYFYFIVKGYIHNKRTTFLVFLTCAIYVLYRFVFTDYISFYSIDLINSFLFYSDLTLVITGFHFLCLVRVFTKNRKRLDERFETERLDTLTSEKHSFLSKTNLMLRKK